MSDEREMILRMLKDGKLSVSEAEALLKVLEDEHEEEGFSATGPADTGSPGSTKAQAAGGESASSPRAEIHHDRDDDHGEHSGRSRFGFNIDLSGISESVRAAMSGVSESLKHAFDGIKDLDLGAEFHRAFGKERAEATLELSHDAAEINAFSVRTDWGDLRVTGGDEETVRVVAKQSAWADSEEGAEAVLEKVAISLTADADGRLELQADVPPENRSRVGIDYEISVPKRLVVHAHTRSGDVWIEGVAGTQQVTTLSGDVSVADASADVTVSSKSGDVIVGTVEGSLTVSSMSGDIGITGLSGELNATTKSGDLRADEVAGTARLRTLSGDVAASIARVGGPIHASAVSGDVGISFPADADLRLRASSTTGDVRCRLPIRVQTHGERSVEGTLGAGTHEVQISSISGDIDIR